MNSGVLVVVCLLVSRKGQSQKHVSMLKTQPPPVHSNVGIGGIRVHLGRMPQDQSHRNGIHFPRKAGKQGLGFVGDGHVGKGVGMKSGMEMVVVVVVVVRDVLVFVSDRAVSDGVGVGIALSFINILITKAKIS